MPPVAAGEPASATTHTPPGTGERPARSSSRQRRRSAWVGGRSGNVARSHLRPHERHVGRRGTGLREDIERGPVGTELRLRDDRKDVAVAERQRPAPKRRRGRRPSQLDRGERRGGDGSGDAGRERESGGRSGQPGERRQAALGREAGGDGQRESQERHVAQPAQERRRAEERPALADHDAESACGRGDRNEDPEPPRIGGGRSVPGTVFPPQDEAGDSQWQRDAERDGRLCHRRVGRRQRGDVGEPAEAVVGERERREPDARDERAGGGRPGRDRCARTQSQRRSPEGEEEAGQRRAQEREAAADPGGDEAGPRARVERPHEGPQDERGHAHPQVARDERRQVAHSGDERIREHQVAVVAAEVARTHVEDGGGAVLPEPPEAAAGDGEHGAGCGGRRATPERAHEEPHPDGDRREPQHVDRHERLVHAAGRRLGDPRRERVVEPGVGVRLACVDAARSVRPAEELADPALVPLHVLMRDRVAPDRRPPRGDRHEPDEHGPAGQRDGLDSRTAEATAAARRARRRGRRRTQP